MSLRVVVAIVLLLLPTVAFAQTEKRIALLIGNRAYDASVGVLKNPHNDITAVGEALARQGFDVLPQIKDARRSAILGGVRELVRRLNTAGAGAIGFLYYSGHGAAEKDTNINYLIPVDAKDPGTSTFWDDSVKLDEVLRLLDGARAAAKFVVFDACRNELQLPSKDTSKGLVPVAEQYGMFIAYASAPGRTASDRGEKSGPYATALAAELGKSGLDHLNLFQNVKEAVLASTAGVQQPWESNGLGQRVYLTGEPTTPADIALWENVSKSGEVSELERYLERFPEGLYANTAKLMIARLSREAVERHEAEAARKAQDEKHAAELQRALENARTAQQALAQAERQRNAAAAREEDLRKAQQALQDLKGSSGGQNEADRVAAVALAQRADTAAQEARATREALAAAEAKRKEAETRLAALEKAEQDRKAAWELLRQKDEAAAKRASIDAEAVLKGQEEFQKRREIKLGDFFSLNDACHVQNPPTVEVVKKPEYGAITLRMGQGVVYSVFRKDRQHCIGAKGPMRGAYYILDEKHRDRTDTDSVTLRARFANGITDTVDYKLDLDARESTRTKRVRQQQ